jgi:hypothetical protein
MGRSQLLVCGFAALSLATASLCAQDKEAAPLPWNDAVPPCSPEHVARALEPAPGDSPPPSAWTLPLTPARWSFLYAPSVELAVPKKVEN